jgi:hypothetical protein
VTGEDLQLHATIGRERPARTAAVACLLVVTASCGGSSRATSTRHVPVVVAVGDIACGEAPTPEDPEGRCRYDLVGGLATSLAPDRFLAVGDIQHTLGGPTDYAAYYGTYFGGLMPITSPTPGDVDWVPSPDAYLAYFGEASGPPGGYYSFDLGTWHIISLNSRDCFDADGCAPGSAQFNWLRADLGSHSSDLYPCTLAFFHDPRFLWVEWWQQGGRPGGPETRVTALWSLLYGGGVDVVINGNAHNYERWAPQDVNGRLDRRRGITEFVVGTGGKRLIPFGPEPRPRHLVTGQDSSYGALRMELGSAGLSYSWRSAPGQPTFHDDGTVACH